MLLALSSVNWRWYNNFESVFNWRRLKFVFSDEYEEFVDSAAGESVLVMIFHGPIKLNFLRASDAPSDNKNGYRGSRSYESEASLVCADYTWWCTHVYESHAELYRWIRWMWTSQSKELALSGCRNRWHARQS